LNARAKTLEIIEVRPGQAERKGRERPDGVARWLEEKDE